MARKPKYCIDAGHGGKDSGATGCGYLEKDVTLRFALALGKALEPYAEIKYTRTTDKTMTLAERVKIANDWGADALISIHLNSFGNVMAKGFEIWVDPKSNRSFKFANSVHKPVIDSKLYTVDRKIKKKGFYVLRYSKMKAILPELCFISNRQDMDLLMNNFDSFVDAVAKGILKDDGITYKPVPKMPEYNPDKILVSLLGHYLSIDGFMKDSVNYVKVKGSYIPLRKIFESLGLSVGWDNKYRIVTADKTAQYKPNKENIEVDIFGVRINVNGMKKDSTNVILIGDIYIPIRDIFESLGLKVGWENNRVVISQ